GPVDDRGEGSAADAAKVADRKTAALHLELPFASLVRCLGQLRGERLDALFIDVADDRDDQPALGVDRHANVIVALQDELVVGEVKGSVEVGKLLQGDRGGLQGEGGDGQLGSLAIA